MPRQFEHLTEMTLLQAEELEAMAAKPGGEVQEMIRTAITEVTSESSPDRTGALVFLGSVGSFEIEAAIREGELFEGILECLLQFLEPGPGTVLQCAIAARGVLLLVQNYMQTGDIADPQELAGRINTEIMETNPNDTISGETHLYLMSAIAVLTYDYEG